MPTARFGGMPCVLVAVAAATLPGALKGTRTSIAALDPRWESISARSVRKRDHPLTRDLGESIDRLDYHRRRSPTPLP